MTEEELEKEENLTPDWLKQVQNMSWEPEILISGGSIIFLFTMTDDFGNLGKLNNHVGGFLSPIIIFQSFIAINIIKIAFSIHLILRGVWTGLIGLSFAYPKGINEEKLKFRGRFLRDLKKAPKPSVAILKLEKICSMIFSFTFMFATMFVGITLLFILGIELFGVFGIDIRGSFENWRSYKLGIMLLAFLGLIELFTGFLKKTKYISNIYYPIYKVFNIITLGFLYRNTYYLIASNINKALIASFFIVISFFGYQMAKGNMMEVFPYEGGHQSFFDKRLYKLNPRFGKHYMKLNNYDNLRVEGALVAGAFGVNFSINSDVIRKGPLKLFIAYDQKLDAYIDPNCESDDLHKPVPTSESRNRIADQHLNCITSLFRISIDDIIYDDIQWQYTLHPSTGQEGIVCYLTLQDFQQGLHQLHIEVRTSKDNFGKSSTSFWIE